MLEKGTSVDIFGEQEKDLTKLFFSLAMIFSSFTVEYRYLGNFE